MDGKAYIRYKNRDGSEDVHFIGGINVEFVFNEHRQGWYVYATDIDRKKDFVFKMEKIMEWRDVLT